MNTPVTQEEYIEKQRRDYLRRDAIRYYTSVLLSLGSVLIALAVVALIVLVCSGCAYKGGRVVDGNNIAVGIAIPGTEWSINILDYVSGISVAGNNSTSITVTNSVEEDNSYFGIISTKRKTSSTSNITPMCFPVQTADRRNGPNKF